MTYRCNFHEIAKKLRLDVLEMSYRAKTSHLASSLSCVDILAVLYSSILKLNPQNHRCPERDRFILSKGHAATALYAALAWKGIISEEKLKSYAKDSSLLEEHPSPKLPGVEASSGSLGHGLAIANGMALASKIQNKKFKVYVLLSDRECNEGSTWEAAMFTSKHSLANLKGIIDYNKWQATERSQEVLALEPLSEKWKSFGWSVKEIDGHDPEKINEALNEESCDLKKPTMIIAHTIKGKGVSFMEDDNNWHYRIPNELEYCEAIKEISMI